MYHYSLVQIRTFVFVFCVAVEGGCAHNYGNCSQLCVPARAGAARCLCRHGYRAAGRRCLREYRDPPHPP